MNPGPPGFLRRHPALATAAAAIAILAAIPFGIRYRGRACYEAAVARLEEAGLGGGPEALRRESPAADPYLQARWRAITVRAGKARLLEARFSGKIPDWLNGGGPEPEGARAAYEADADIRVDAVALFAEGTPVAGGLGSWLAGGGGSVSPFVGLRCDSLLGVRGLARLFLAEAAFESDPGPALAALDRMHEVFAHPGCAMDGMIGICMADARDEAYARLAAARRLPPAAAAPWLAEEPVEPLRTARALRGERVLFLEPIAGEIDEGTLSGAALAGGFANGNGVARFLEGRVEAAAWWLRGGEACALVLDRYREAEIALRGGTAIPARTGPQGLAGRLAEFLGAHTGSLAAAAYIGRQRHRVARAFVRAMAEPREGVLLPGGPLDLPVVAEWAAPDRLRVRADGREPLPPALRGMVMPDLPDAAAPNRKPFTWGAWFVEADVARK